MRRSVDVFSSFILTGNVTLIHTSYRKDEVVLYMGRKIQFGFTYIKGNQAVRVAPNFDHFGA